MGSEMCIRDRGWTLGTLYVPPCPLFFSHDEERDVVSIGAGRISFGGWGIVVGRAVGDWAAGVGGRHGRVSGSTLARGVGLTSLLQPPE